MARRRHRRTCDERATTRGLSSNGTCAAIGAAAWFGGSLSARSGPSRSIRTRTRSFTTSSNPIVGRSAIWRCRRNARSDATGRPLLSWPASSNPTTFTSSSTPTSKSGQSSSAREGTETAFPSLLAGSHPPGARPGPNRSGASQGRYRKRGVLHRQVLQWHLPRGHAARGSHYRAGRVSWRKNENSTPAESDNHSERGGRVGRHPGTRAALPEPGSARAHSSYGPRGQASIPVHWDDVRHD